MSTAKDKKASGRAVIERGTNPLARPIAWLFGFPPAGHDVPVTVAFRGDNGREIWQRDFGGRRFASVLSAGTGRSDHLIEEHFGPITVALAVVATEAGLALMVRRWCLFGIPLPLRFGPITESYERVENGCFAFDIDIRLPLIGRIVRYRGALAIVDS